MSKQLLVLDSAAGCCPHIAEAALDNDRRANLWDRYGIRESPGYYMALARKRHRDRQ